MTNGTTSEQIVERPNSVELAINAKGQWSGKVKAYEELLEDAWSQAKEYAEKLARLIEQKNRED